MARLAIIVLTICLLNLVTPIIDRTFFKYLGLTISAGPKEIGEAYARKMKNFEAIQDLNEKEKKVELLTAAYQALSNEKERQKYERYGKDIFKSIKEISSINNMDPFNPTDSRKAKSFKITFPISIFDLYRGTTVKAKLPKSSACENCQGTGANSPKDRSVCMKCSGKGFNIVDGKDGYGRPMKVEHACDSCQGQGKKIIKSCQSCNGKRIKTQMEDIKFVIPAGTRSGQVLTFRNYGSEPLFGAPADFQVTIEEISTKEWERDRQNLIHYLQISLEEALLGFTREITLLNGEQLEIEREKVVTTSESSVTFSNKGFPTSNGRQGPLIVKFKIRIPQFTDAQMNLWEDYFKAFPK